MSNKKDPKLSDVIEALRNGFIGIDELAIRFNVTDNQMEKIIDFIRTTGSGQFLEEDPDNINTIRMESSCDIKTIIDGLEERPTMQTRLMNYLMKRCSTGATVHQISRNIVAKQKSVYPMLTTAINEGLVVSRI